MVIIDINCKFGVRLAHRVSFLPILIKVPIIFKYVAGEDDAPLPDDPTKECSAPC